MRAVVRRNAKRRGEHQTLELAVGRLVQAGIVALGPLVAATAAFSGFTPASLASALGIGGVAIGFAFKDIFQNFLAGILILITKPFRVGDQIIFGPYEGTVEDIETRATFIKTYDGRRVIIPNGELYTQSVTVNTAFPKRRWQYDIGIGYGDDVDEARDIILRVLQEAEDVAPDPKADVIVVDLAESTVNLRARWWTDSHMADGLNAQHRVLVKVKRELAAAGIDPTVPNTADPLPRPDRSDRWRPAPAARGMARGSGRGAGALGHRPHGGTLAPTSLGPRRASIQPRRRHDTTRPSVTAHVERGSSRHTDTASAASRTRSHLAYPASELASRSCPARGVVCSVTCARIA